MAQATLENTAGTWEPVKIGYQAALIGPLLYVPGTDKARDNPRRVALYAPANYVETMEQVAECHERGATSVHIHPIEEGTGIHKKTPGLYSRNAHGARLVVPGIVVNNDASLNGVGLSTKCGPEEYLDTRLAGLMNGSPPDVFTLFATNEALMVADTAGGFPRSYVEEFIRAAGGFLARHKITALAEISQDPYGLRSVRRGLEILDQSGIKLPALSFSFLINGTPMLPGFAGKPLTFEDENGVVRKETPKERFMRVVQEAVDLKHRFGLKGPLTFGTVVPPREGGEEGVIQHTVWDWIADFAAARPEAAREFGIVVKAGLEEWSGYKGRQISNPDAVTAARDYLEAKTTASGERLFEPVTDVQVMRQWVYG